MKIDQHKIDADTHAKFCRRSHFVRALALACLFSSAASPAMARYGDKEHGPSNKPERMERRQEMRAQHQAQAPQQRQAEPLRNDMRQFDARAEEHRRALQDQQDAQARGNDSNRRGGRLTPDERRDLRRQINEAGADLYRNTPRR